MRNLHQFPCEIRSKNQYGRRFAQWLWWPLAVTMLRIGYLITTGHPLQVSGGTLCENIGVSVSRYPAGYYAFLCSGGL
jgi:hypothetical protein